MKRDTNIFVHPRALSLFFLALAFCAHPFSGRAGDYAEHNALTWSAFASDQTTVNLSDDVTHVRAGEFSLRFDTASGFDTGVRYPGTASAHWNLTTNTHLVFWCYGVNTNTFQGNQPVIVLNSPAGSYRYEPDHIVTANGSWTLVKVPLAGDAHWLRTTTGSPTLTDVTQLEIHQDTWDYGFTMFYDGVQFLTLGTNGPAMGPPAPSGVNPDAVIQRVLLFVYDPIMENKGGRRMHEVYGWTAPETLTQGILHDFNSNSHSLYLPQIVETRIADEYPLLLDGFRYGDTSYDQAVQSGIWHDSVFDYWQFMLDHDLVSRVESGDFDEIWIYGSPGSGMWESTMAGKGGYLCNSSPVPGATNQHLVVIMGWNFERGVGEAIHSFGHRAESIMSKIYDGQWLLSRANAWSAFALLDKDAPGLGGVGDVHFPVNGLIDYDWANTNFVWSACDAWANYPYLTNSARSINFHEWSPAGEDPQREYLNWWYAHFPRRAGKAPSPDDRLNNWWRYLIDVDQFKNGDGTLISSSGIGSAQITSPTNTSFVDGIVPVTVDALVDGALGRVDLYVDGVYYASDFLAPFKFSWVTDGLLGAHTLTAKAYELQAGTETVSSSITVNVRGASVSGVVQSNAVPVSGVTVTALGSVRRWLRQTASPGTPIPDNNFGGVTNVIEITQTGAISSVHVGVTVRHPRRSDLRLTLIHPNGTTVRLASEGGNAEPDLIAFYPDLTVPAESFSALDNLPVTGTWKLIVADLSPGVSGQVESWSLGLNYLEPQTFVATTDLNGSYSFTNLPTGDYEIRPTKPGVTFLPMVTNLSLSADTHNASFETVTNGAPDSTITAPADNVTIGVGQSVNFAGNGSDPDNNLPLTYQWTFGSGSGLPNSTVQNPGSLQFANAGSFPVTFTVTDGLGLADAAPATLTITVTNQGAASILANGSFESGYTGWTATGNQAINARASDGTNAVQFNPGQLTPNGVLAQTFATTVGQTYQVAFEIGADWGTPSTAQSLQTTVTGNSTLFSQIVTVFGTGDSSSKYTSTNFTFLANSTTTTLTFQDVSPTGLNIDLLLDNVRVSALGNQAPDGTIALPSGNRTIGVGQSVNFAGSGTDPDNNLPITYQWTFGSGSGLPNSTVQNPGSLQFANAGSFPVTFTVTDGLGLADATPATLTITVTNQGPATSLANGSFELGYTGWTPSGNQWISIRSSDGTNAVQFNPGQAAPNGVLSQAFATTPGQTYLLAFEIGADWGTPSTAQSLQTTVTGNSTLFSQIVTVFGTGDSSSKYTSTNFTFLANSTTTTLTFQDVSPTGLNIDLLLDNVRVSALGNQAPDGTIALPSGNRTIGVGQSVNFAGSGSDPDNNLPLTYQWTFGSGSGLPNSIVQNPGSLQFASAGSFLVTLTVTDGLGLADPTPDTLTITVTNQGPATILVNGSFELGYTGWTPSGNQWISIRSSDGTNAVEFNPGQATPNGVLSQAFATTSGQTYLLAFDIGADWGTPSTAQSLRATVTGNSTLFSQVVTVFGPGDVSSKYTSTNFTFLANSATTTLTFQDVSPTGLNVDLLLDNVRITGLPVITNQPPNLSISVGATATFTVGAAGTAPLSYQWRFNGASVSGATTTSYMIANVQAANAGNYDAVISNSAGSVTSAVAVLTVSSGILANGSFESGYTGWTASGNQAINARASDGTNAVQFNPGQLTPNGVLAQTFATTVGQTYKVAFDIGTDWGTPGTAQSLRATVIGNSTLFSQIVTVFGTGDSSSKYTSTNFTFLANSITTTLTFQDVSPTGLNVDLLLDNVRITAQGGQALVVAAHPGTQTLSTLGMLSIDRQAEGSQIHLEAAKKGDYELQYSRDLKVWNSLGIKTASGAEGCEFLDTNAPQALRFYRILAHSLK